MKILYTLLLSLFLVSCQTIHNTETIEKKNDSIQILYVWKNYSSAAEYYVSIFCYQNDTSFQKILSIPDNQLIEVYVDNSCNEKRIPPEILNILTTKKFNTVQWFREILGTNEWLYNFHDEEILQITSAPWEYLEIENLSIEHYKLIRNSINPVRKWFGLGTKINIYTEKERSQCNIFFTELWESQDENKWNEARRNSEDCFKNLLPIK